mgnify:FL=1
MNKIKNKRIPKWIEESKKEKKQEDTTMKVFLLVAFLIILLGAYDNCTNLILR